MVPETTIGLPGSAPRDTSRRLADSCIAFVIYKILEVLHREREFSEALCHLLSPYRIQYIT